MLFNTMLSERFKFKEIVLLFFTGVAYGLLYILSTGLPMVWTILLLFAMLMPCIALLTGSPKRFLLGLLILFIPINVDKNFFLHSEHTGGAVGLSISIWEISLFFLIIMWCYEVAIKRERKFDFLPQFSIPIFCLIGISLLSMINSFSTTLSIFEIIQLVKMYLLFFYIAHCIKTEGELRYILLILFSVFCLENVFGLFQYVSERSFDLAVLGGGEEKFATKFVTETAFRIPGTFGDSNIFGSYLAMILSVVLSFSFYKRSLSKLFCSFLFIIGTIVLILTLSRGAWLGFLGSIVMVLFLLHTKIDIKLKTIFRVGVFFLIIALLFFNFREIILLRIYGEDYGSALSRITMMRIAYEMIKANLFLGVGINNYSEVMANYDPTGLTFVYFQPVHNVYLQIAAEMGIPGLCAFLWFLFVLYRKALRNIMKTNDFISHLRIGVVGGITALLLHSMVNNGSLGDDIFILFWFFAGLLVATIRVSSKIEK